MTGVARLVLLVMMAAVLAFPAQADPPDRDSRLPNSPITHDSNDQGAQGWRRGQNGDGNSQRDQDRGGFRPPSLPITRDNDDQGRQRGQDWQRWQNGGRQAQQRGYDRDDGAAPLLPLEAVLANVGRSIPGHHIGVDGPYQQGNRYVYRIKWLTPDGRVIFVIADAQTGQILGTRGGR